MKKSMTKRTTKLFFYIFTAAWFLFVHTGCGIKTTQLVQPMIAAVEKEPVPDINRVTLQDHKAIYLEDDDGSVVTMYLTVRRGNPAAIRITPGRK